MSNCCYTQRDYSIELLDREEDMMWDQFGLDIMQRQKIRDMDVGTFEAQAAASGVVLGQDSSANVASHIITESSLDELVMRHNADLKATEILNAKARSLWESEIAIQQTLWEGSVGISTGAINTMASAMGIGAQTALDSSVSMNNTYLSNWSNTYNANLQAQQYTRAANQAWVNGAFQFGSSMASAYARS